MSFKRALKRINKTIANADSIWSTLLSELYLAGDFNKSTFEAELQCGNQTCLDMSIAQSKICKPFLKPTTKLDQVTLVLLIFNGCSFFLMICFDLLFIKFHRNGHEKPKKPLSKLSFVVLFATTILYLSSKSFDKALFCSMNINEKICGKQRKYRHEGALHTIEDPIYVSAPCRVLPLGYAVIRDLDILVIDQSVSPCSLELRSNFFIENFQMSATVNPNDFVLLNRDLLSFASHIDFHSWSKQGNQLQDSS